MRSAAEYGAGSRRREYRVQSAPEDKTKSVSFAFQGACGARVTYAPGSGPLYGRAEG